MAEKTLIIFLISSMTLMAEQATLQPEESVRTGMPPLYNESRLMQNVLSFPEFSRDYLNRIYVDSGFISVWPEKKIKAFAATQGLTVNEDSSLYHSEQLRRAAVFTAPGLSFNMQAPANERGEFSPQGWWLIIDLALLRSQKQENRNYNFYAVYIDGILQKKIYSGYSSNETTPIKIPVPFIRNQKGKIKVEIRLNNSPSSFGFLYDAVLVKKL